MRSLRALAEALEVVAGADTMGMTWLAAVPDGGGAAGAPTLHIAKSGTTTTTRTVLLADSYVLTTVSTEVLHGLSAFYPNTPVYHIQALLTSDISTLALL